VTFELPSSGDVLAKDGMHLGIDVALQTTDYWRLYLICFAVLKIHLLNYDDLYASVTFTAQHLLQYSALKGNSKIKTAQS